MSWTRILTCLKKAHQEARTRSLQGLHVEGRGAQILKSQKIQILLCILFSILFYSHLLSNYETSTVIDSDKKHLDTLMLFDLQWLGWSLAGLKMDKSTFKRHAKVAKIL